MMMSSTVRNITLWVVILVVAYMVFKFFSGPITGQQEVQETRFYEWLEQRRIASVVITPSETGFNIAGKLKDDPSAGSGSFQTFVLRNDDLAGLMRRKGVDITTQKPSEGAYWVTLL